MSCIAIHPPRARQSPRLRTSLLPTAATAALALLAGSAWAAWPTDPGTSVFVPLSSVATPSAPQVLPDSSGGAVFLASLTTGISALGWFGQRIDTDAQVRWPADGVWVGDAPASPAAADGAGGAYLAVDLKSTIVLQHLKPDGTVVGVTVATPTSTSLPHVPVVVPDGSGGAVVAWWDARSPFGWWAQRVDAAGSPSWAAGGVAMQGTSQFLPIFWVGATPDGTGGIILLWSAYGASGARLKALRVDGTGVRQWAPGGVAVCDAAGDQSLTSTSGDRSPWAVADGAGGAIVAWNDTRSEAAGDLYAQRLDPTGARLWTADGVAVCVRPGAFASQRLIGDGGGGAIVAWQDTAGRGGAPGDGTANVYGQRIDGAGAARWTTDGVALGAAVGDQRMPAIASGGAGSAWVAWSDDRDPGAPGAVYAQSVDSSGATRWDASGTAVALPGSSFRWLPAIAPDGRGGAIVGWLQHDPAVLQSRIFAARVPVPTPVAVKPTRGSVALRIGPNPARGATSVTFTLAGSGGATLDLLDIAGRVVRSRLVRGAGAQSVALQDLGSLPCGVYVVRLREGQRVRSARLLLVR